MLKFAFDGDMKFYVELEHEYTYQLCALSVTNIMTLRIVEVLLYKFNIVIVCTGVNYAQKWVT